jgi:hypothetical protein
MTNIIYLDQPTATTMTSVKEMLKVYSRQNDGGKYDEAVERYRGVYKALMNEILGKRSS